MFLYGDVAGIAMYMIIEKRIHLYYCLKVMKATNLLLCLLMTVAVIVIFTLFALSSDIQLTCIHSLVSLKKLANKP